MPSQGLPRRAIENCDAEDWDRLLGTIFEVLGGPADLDGLVAAVIELCGLKEDWQESLGGGDDDEVAEDLSDAIADSGSTPEQDAEVNSALRQLWTAITRLKNDYRCAYLLNIPGPGKSRGDIEVFAMRGIASIVEIGAAIDLSERQYELLWGLLDLEAADFGELARISSPEQKFCLLWKYLPLDDATIARLLGLERQQVINRRTMAVRELARSCGSNGRE